MASSSLLFQGQAGQHHIYGRANVWACSKVWLPTQQAPGSEFRLSSSSSSSLVYPSIALFGGSEKAKVLAFSARPPRDRGEQKKQRDVGQNDVVEDFRRNRSHPGGTVLATAEKPEPERLSRVQGRNGAVESERNRLMSTDCSEESYAGSTRRKSSHDEEDEDDLGDDVNMERGWRKDSTLASRGSRARSRRWKPQDGRETEWGSELLVRRDPSSFDMAVVTQMSSGQLSVTVRVLYSLAMYGGMALVGKFICDAAGVDCWGGFRLDAEDFYSALLYALPPIFGSLVLHQDSVVESWAPARAVRDAEDEELVDFFVGMAVWQYTLIGSAAAIAEELFFRAAVQGGLAHAMQVTSKGVTDATYGMAAITGVIPTLVPCSQAMAGVLTAVITGSMFYVISTPKDPKVVVARGNPREMRKSIGAWHERQKLKKIYSPLVESLLSLYLSFEWIATGNIMAPMVTHALYYISTVSTGVRRIEERERTLKRMVMLKRRETERAQAKRVE